MVSDASVEEEALLETWLKKVSRALAEAKVAKFDGQSWQSWERIVVSDLTPIRLFKHLTMSQTQADLDLLSQLEKEKHVLADLKLTNYLLVRLTPIPQRAVTSCKSAFHIWQKLKSLYASTSKVAQATLKDKWESFCQLPGQRVVEYIQALEYLADSMELALIPQDDEAKLHRLLKGISSDWAADKRYFQLSKSTYSEVCTMLQELGEQIIEETNHRQIIPAFNASTDRKNPRLPKFPVSVQQTRKPTCYTCGGSDHIQEHCPTGLRPSKTEDGRFIPRCFTCLQEGHRSRDCPKRNRKERAATWGTALHTQVEAFTGNEPAQEASQDHNT
jgi:hypothetical protein